MKLELELSTREQYIITLSLSVSIIAGPWLDILMIPPRTLDVSVHSPDDGAVSAPYYPVTSTRLFVSAISPPATTCLMRDHARDNGTDNADELMSDHSDGDEDGRDSAHSLNGSSTSEFDPYPPDGGESAWPTRTLP